jgi:hypothetical protein
MLVPMNARNSSRQDAGGRRDHGPQGTAVVAHEDLPASAGVRRGGHAGGTPALVGLTPPFADQRFPLPASESRIGRDADNTIVIDHPGISAVHARVYHDQGRWTVLNVLSTNGIFVNDQPVHEAEIHDGDRIALGNIAFEFRLREPEPVAPADGWQRPGVILAGVLVLTLIVIGAILLL